MCSWVDIVSLGDETLVIVECGRFRYWNLYEFSLGLNDILQSQRRVRTVFRTQLGPDAIVPRPCVEVNIGLKETALSSASLLNSEYEAVGLLIHIIPYRNPWTSSNTQNLLNTEQIGSHTHTPRPEGTVMECAGVLVCSWGCTEQLFRCSWTRLRTHARFQRSKVRMICV